MRITALTHDWSVIGDLDPLKLVSAKVIDEVNGENALVVETLQELAKGDRLLWRDGTGTWHEYVVYGISSYRIGPDAVAHRYYCPWSIQYDLQETTTTAMPGTGGTPASATTALQGALQGTSRWTVGTVQPTTTGSTSFWRMSGWEAMQKLVSVWGGEVRADITVTAGWAITRSVSLLNHIGSSTPTRRYDYGADITGIERNVLEQPWTCCVIPLGAAQETEGGGYGRKITIEDVNGGVAYLENPNSVNATRKPDGNGGWEYPTQHVENPEAQTPQELLDWATEHLDEWTMPQVSYTLDVLQLASAGSASGVSCGDEVIVVDSAFGSAGIRITARVVRIELDLIDPTGTIVTISNVPVSLGLQLTDIAQVGTSAVTMIQEISEYQATPEYVSDLIGRINSEANLTGGYTYITEGGGNRTYDVPVTDPMVGTEASAVVAVTGGNIGISNEKSGGSWVWKTLLSSGVINAELVAAAQIIAGYIGDANSGNYWNLDTGEFRITSSSIIREYNGSVLICYENQTLGALVNASGSFDVVALTWADGEPTVGDVISTQSTRKLLVGNTQTPSMPMLDFDNGDFTVGTGSGTQLKMLQSPTSPNDYLSVMVGGTKRIYVSLADVVGIVGQLTRTDTLPVELVESTGMSSKVGVDTVSVDTALEETSVLDATSFEMYESKLYKTANGPAPEDDGLCKGITLRRTLADDSIAENGFTLHVHKDGTPVVTFPSTAVADAWRNAIGNTWTSVATTSGTTETQFDVSGYGELLVVATYSTTFAASVLVPVAALTSSNVDWYLGAWGYNGTYNASCKLNISSNMAGITPYQLVVNGSRINGNWAVYAR